MAEITTPRMTFTPELGEAICEAIASSPYGLARVCRENPSFPAQSTIMKWLTQEDKEDFAEQYAHACARRADLLFDEMLDIADDSTGDPERGDNGKETQHATEQVARSKLRVDTRKWMASKLAPKKYGDRLELGGELNHTVAARMPTRAEILAAQQAEIARYETIALAASAPQGSA